MEMLMIVSWLAALSFPVVLCLGLVWVFYNFLDRLVTALTGCL